MFLPEASTPTPERLPREGTSPRASCFSDVALWATVATTPRGNEPPGELPQRRGPLGHCRHYPERERAPRRVASATWPSGPLSPLPREGTSPPASCLSDVAL